MLPHARNGDNGIFLPDVRQLEIGFIKVQADKSLRDMYSDENSFSIKEKYFLKWIAEMETKCW